MANRLRDLQFGWRLLRRNKGFASVAILALALGIGPNGADANHAGEPRLTIEG